MNANRLVALLAAVILSVGEWTGFFALLSLSTSATLAGAHAVPAAAAETLPEIVVTAHRPS